MLRCKADPVPITFARTDRHTVFPILCALNYLLETTYAVLKFAYRGLHFVNYLSGRCCDSATLPLCKIRYLRANTAFASGQTRRGNTRQHVVIRGNTFSAATESYFLNFGEFGESRHKGRLMTCCWPTRISMIAFLRSAHFSDRRRTPAAGHFCKGSPC